MKFLNKEKMREHLKNFLTVVMYGVIFYFVFTSISSFFDKSSKSEAKSKDCNVANIKVYGHIASYSKQFSIQDPLNEGDKVNISTSDTASADDIIKSIAEANDDKNIKALLITINSPGGTPVAGEDIADAIKHSPKPTVALIRDIGASAAYWVASGANTIFASKNSDVGSIGVTQSYLDDTEKNTIEGLKYIDLSIGKYKDTGAPGKPLTEEEKKLLFRDIEIVYQNFVQAVSENRNLPFEKVGILADGSTMLGEMALQNGLIDKIGGIYEVKDYLREKIGEDVKLCE